METFGRYELLRKLASGGMGQIFLARQKGPVGFQKLLVVKRILPHLSEEEEFIKMFLDEARIAALLNHPNIAHVYDSGEVDGVFYMAMEYVQGEPLALVHRKALEEKGGLPLALKVRIITDAAAALDYAHTARSPSGRPLGVIHRDVSPQNVLVGYHGTVKLIDFGVAKATNKLSHTSVGAIKGKYAYMSPEQALGQELDGRSDVFGLGVLLYELLTGARLFKRESDHATLKAVVGTRVPPPSSLVPEVPASLDAVVLKALAKKREERFHSAGELQLALEEVLMHERLPGTAAHLGAFMRDLYAQELEEEHFSNEPTVLVYAPSSLSSSRPSPPPPAEARPRPRPPSRASAAGPSPESSRSGRRTAASHSGRPRPPRPARDEE